MLKLTANNWYLAIDHSKRVPASSNRDTGSVSDALDSLAIQTLIPSGELISANKLADPLGSASCVRVKDSGTFLKRMWGTCVRGTLLPTDHNDSRNVLVSIFDRVPLRNVWTVEEELQCESPSDYTLIDKLGEGGMGVVMSARQRGTRRLVALKIIKNKLLSQPEAVYRFLFEAEILAELDHPSVVPIYEVAASSNMLFFSMKLLEGLTWRQRIPQLSRAENVDVLSKVCDAIVFAHSKGIIHRDLKPENVIVGSSGEVFVTDWGLAIHQKKDTSPIVAIEPGDKSRLTVVDVSRFRIGDRVFLDSDGTDPNVFQVKSIMADNSVGLDRPLSNDLELSPNLTIRKWFGLGGTPAYMSPESASHKIGQIGPLSDVYLLGAMLFEVLTLEPPHRGSTVEECLNAAIKNDVSERVFQTRTAADAELMRVARKAMSTDPKDRFATAQDFQSAMRQCLFVRDR